MFAFLLSEEKEQTQLSEFKVESVRRYRAGWNTLMPTSQVWAALVSLYNFFSCNGRNSDLIDVEGMEFRRFWDEK